MAALSRLHSRYCDFNGKPVIILTELTGWILVLGWHTYPALVCVTFTYVVNSALLVGGMAEPLSASAQTGVSIVAACLAGLINTKFLRVLSYLELLFGVIYVLLAILITFPVFALAPRRSASDIFVNFHVFSTYVGDAIPIMQGGAVALSMHIGYDCVIHMGKSHCVAQSRRF